MKIEEIEGIGNSYATKLREAGVNSVEKLLEFGGSRTGRKHLADTTGIDERKLLDWVNMADLFRINGVATQFAELLVEAGVDTVKELKHRNAANLHEALVELNEKKHLTKIVPSVETLQGFIEQAKMLEPMITH